MSDVERTTRICTKCGQTDSDPHHVQYVAFTHPVTGPQDVSVSKHIDCCAEDGCPICTDELARSQADQVHLRDWVHAKPEDHLQLLFEKHGIESPGHERQPA